MNIKTASKRLENYFDEFKKAMPLTVLSNGAIGYKEYVIKPKKNGSWNLCKIYGKHLVPVDTFNLKSCAIVSAVYHEANQLQKLLETKQLDDLYYSNYQDSVFFKHFYNKTTDPVKKDNYLWRQEITTQRATFYKDKISKAFRTVFR